MVCFFWLQYIIARLGWNRKCSRATPLAPLKFLLLLSPPFSPTIAVCLSRKVWSCFPKDILKHYFYLLEGFTVSSTQISILPLLLPRTSDSLLVGKYFFLFNIQKGTQQELTKCILPEEKLSGFPKTTQIKRVGEGRLKVLVTPSLAPKITQTACIPALRQGFLWDKKGKPGRWEPGNRERCLSRHAPQHTEGRQTYPGVHRGAPKGDGSRLLEGHAKLKR